MRIKSISLGFLIYVLIAVMVIGAGLFLKTLARLKYNDRCVTVKGLDEQIVKANLAIWKIHYNAIGTDITQLNDKIQQDQTLIVAFLKQQGLTDNEIELRGNALTDSSSRDKDAKFPYLINGTVIVRSANVDLVHKISQMTGDLIRQGIVLTSATYEANPIYFYTTLNAIRPLMLAHATRSAREVAQQFAKDSKAHLGVIRRANQGVFVITSRDSTNGGSDYDSSQDEKQSIYKKVRLVVTIDYFLAD